VLPYTTNATPAGAHPSQTSTRSTLRSGIDTERWVYINYSARVSPARIRSRIKTIVRETGRALLVVDSLQLMQTDQRNARQSPYERVTEISRELKILAVDTGAVLIALPPQYVARLFDARNAGASEQQLRTLAGGALGEVYLRDGGRRAHGLEVEFTDVERLEFDL
jgi:hypothetical protein